MKIDSTQTNCLDPITYSKLTVHATIYAKINIKGNIKIAFNSLAKKLGNNHQKQV